MTAEVGRGLHHPREMSQARVQRELEASEPWRKAGFKVKPYYGNDQEDAKRFVKELPTQLDLDLLKGC